MAVHSRPFNAGIWPIAIRDQLMQPRYLNVSGGVGTQCPAQHFDFLLHAQAHFIKLAAAGNHPRPFHRRSYYTCMSLSTRHLRDTEAQPLEALLELFTCHVTVVISVPCLK